MSVADDLNTVADDLTTLQGVVAQAVTDLNTPATESVGDKVLASLTQVLTDAGYTVTPPSVETTTETPAEDTTDTPSEA